MTNRFLADLKKAVNQAVHQCNNHLSIILNNCELSLASKDFDSAKKKIEGSILRVNQLTELLLQLNRFAAVNGDIRLTGLRPLFESPLKQIEARAKTLQIGVSAHVVADGVFAVPADAIQLLIEHLGSNAISAASAGADSSTGKVKKITFEVLQMNKEITILAANSGNAPEGISEKIVFNSYFTDRSQPAFEYLAAIKSLTEILGGQMTYKKKSDMNEVYVKLPLQYDSKVF